MSNCLICGVEKNREALHVIVLTEEERAQVPNPLDEYTYCKPCWKVLSDPRTAPALISGIAQHRLAELGVSRADEMAEKLRSKLTDRALRKT
jgi:hypothetical protein